MTDHIERVKIEWTDLQEKIGKLADFVQGPVCADLPLVDQQLLHGQLGAMRAYGCILTQRWDRADAQALAITEQLPSE